MRYALLTGGLALAAVLMVACERPATHSAGPQAGKGTASAGTSGSDEEPLLLLDDEPPLLLEDGNGGAPAKAPGADNSRCHVCHLNYQDERLAVVHARAGIGCADCHGDSDAHIADESWASGGNGTPPERMFPRPKITPFCLSCHPKNKIEKKEKHREFFAAAIKEKYCTDCHGDHRLPQRKCKWK